GLVFGLGLDQYPHNVALFHDEVLDTIDFDLGARPFAEQDAVADLDVDWDKLAALVAATGSNGYDLALLRLLLGGVGNDDTAGGLRLGIDSLDDNLVVKRSEFHWCTPGVLSKSLRIWKADRHAQAQCVSEISAARSDQATLLIPLDTLVLMGSAALVAVSW